MSERPPIGSLLQAEVGADRMPLAALSCVDPAKAAARALAAYLRGLVFRVAGMPPRDFRLEKVLEEWPESSDRLDYPSASIFAPATPESPHNLTPTMLEETFELYGPGTVLWQTAELRLDFQVDFWVTKPPEREAIAAHLEEAFNPTERRAGIVVQGDPDYWDRPVRLTYTSHHRADDAQTVFQGVDRLTTIVVADIEVVQLRQAVLLRPVLSLDGEAVPPVADLEPTGGT